MARRLPAAAASLGLMAASPPPTPLSEIVVTGGPAPRLVASFPANGSEVAAGVLALKLTFDKPMSADSWSYGPAANVAFPTCLDHPRLLADGRTFVLLCTVAAHQAYGLKINVPKDFAARGGRLAEPADLTFHTGETESRTLHDALAAAGLTDADEPLPISTDSGAGVSRHGEAP